MTDKILTIASLCPDRATVRSLTEHLGRRFKLSWFADSKSLIRHCAETEVRAIIVDHAVGSEEAINALKAAHAARASALRLLLAGQADLGLIVQGLHTGAVQRIVYKPIHAPELLAALGVQQAAVEPPNRRAAAPAGDRV